MRFPGHRRRSTETVRPELVEGQSVARQGLRRACMVWAGSHPERSGLISVSMETVRYVHPARGMRRMKDVVPCSETTETSPPCATTIDLTIASPSPELDPSRCRDGSTR